MKSKQVCNTNKLNRSFKKIYFRPAPYVNVTVVKTYTIKLHCSPVQSVT
jgi:hypothetical protein